jgi:S-adenosyl methyltransferase
VSDRVLGVAVEPPEWVPEGVDVKVPNAARVYDYALGGHHNFAVDREFLHQLEVAWPDVRQGAYANRAYLGRVVRWLVGAGIRQFLDIGSGIPTLGNVHEVAQEAAPEARVMYVDIDPVAVEHSRAMLAGNPRAGVIEGNLRRPEEILYHPDVVELLDFSQPMAVLLIAVLPFIPDAEDPAGILARINETLVSGSYLAISHGTFVRLERRPGQEAVRKLYEQTPTPFQLRTEEQIRGLLSGLEIVPPGVVPVTDWHPDPDGDEPPQHFLLAAVARKP